MTTDATTGADQTSAVTAHCTACDDVHPVGDRPMDGITTVCPHCGATGYTTECTADPIEKSHAERIADAVRDVRGVGEQTRTNIVAAYETYYAFEAADADALQEIDGVGRQTAQRIITAR